MFIILLCQALKLPLNAALPGLVPAQPVFAMVFIDFLGLESLQGTCSVQWSFNWEGSETAFPLLPSCTGAETPVSSSLLPRALPLPGWDAVTQALCLESGTGPDSSADSHCDLG